MPAPPTRGNWISILLLGAIWGGTFMFVKIALEGFAPLTVAAARTALGAIALSAGCLFAQRFKISWTAIFYLIPVGLLTTAVPFFLLSWGVQYVPSAFAGLAMAALPLFVVPLAHFFSDEKMDLRKVIGILIGFAGASVLFLPDLLGAGAGVSAVVPQLACLGAAVSYAVGSVLTRMAPPMPSIPFSSISLSIGSMALVPAAIWHDGLPAPSGGRADLAIVFLGLVPTALATILRVRVIQSAGSVFMTLVNYQVPLWAVAFGAVVMGETLSLSFFLALTLILIGLAISEYGQLRRLYDSRRQQP